MSNQNEMSKVDYAVSRIKEVISPTMGNWPELYTTVAKYDDVIGVRTVFIDIVHEAKCQEDSMDRIKKVLISAAQNILDKLLDLGYSVTEGENVFSQINGGRAFLTIRCSLNPTVVQQPETTNTADSTLDQLQEPDPHGIGTTILDPQ